LSVLHTRFCELTGVQYPIVQTGMGWVANAALAAAVSEAGGLGIVGAATMSVAETAEAIAAVKALTSKPFGINFRADQVDVLERCDLLAEQDVCLASFAGAPNPTVVERLKAGGVLTMPTVGARRHAEKVVAIGVDIIIAQGGEGGGHTGSIPTSLLLPQVVDAVGDKVPVLGAGGFKDGRGLVAALAFGADGVAMGTRFLMTAETQVPDRIKARYVKVNEKGTVVTKAIDGYPQRVIRTEAIDRLERAGALTRLYLAFANALKFRSITGTSIPDLLREGFAMRKSRGLTRAQMIMGANAPIMTRASMVDGDEDVGILPTGQVAGIIDDLPPAGQVIARLVVEAEETLARLQSPGQPAIREVAG
jgi:NAD(P)H-dependent flavin oxidoreductase YrpB (nitropropane dioxygenase family)